MADKVWKLGIIGGLGVEEYSLSPVMHREVLEQAGFKKSQYVPLPVEPDDLFGWLETKAFELDGFNITMPHKERVYDWIKKNPDRASLGDSSSVDLIGAVNTVKVEQRKLNGFNTDRQGFFGPLNEEKGPTCLKNKRVLLLGAGGAARAILVSLESYGASAVTVWNRDSGRAKQLVEELKKKLEADGGSRCDLSYRENLPNTLSDVDVLVNATPVGMKDSDPLLIDAASLEARHWVYDIVYWPKKTKLIQAAARRSCEVIVPGMKMLAHQGAEALEIWTGANAVRGKRYVDIMLRKLDEHFAGRG